MRIAVWGGGSIGLLWAGRLAERFPETILLTRTREQRDQIRANGLRVTKRNGRESLHSVYVEWSGDHGLPVFDVIFLAVKQTDVAKIASELPRVCHSSTDIWLWQNGMGQEKQLRGYFPQEHLYHAVTTEGAMRRGLSHVEHTGEGESRIGQISEGNVSPITEKTLSILSSSELSIAYDLDIKRVLWEKLAINSVINPLTSLWNLSNGDLLDQDGFKPWMEGILDEVVQVAAFEGTALEPRTLVNKILAVCKKTAANQSSMLQDLKRGKKTEIDFINGAVVAKGKQHGISTPVNAKLTQLVYRAEETGIPVSGIQGFHHLLTGLKVGGDTGCLTKEDGRWTPM
ncbi:ketopantoate reductase family protein [Melghirimyces algeriensis]|uniref:2-dehydropantoate 2-reductase n=1 Tax=Melghirimyces algeriensis TaxID=910412 RepID=A0A521BMG2_9BACL|nr:2-dehydropantoate 2-reductase [Melghirimyces algeriensis]SMO48306.1 ketopantoate reductase [Melghirimyces algeriensis]